MSPLWWEKFCGRLPSPQAAGSAPVDHADVERRVALLQRLAREFGYDPSLVSLSLEPSSFTLAGESCAAEGRALPDGRILIYYDPRMSNARMGCCLAHEIQHQKYFAVREAFRREAPDGPLHCVFARFTPELLAARRGVSDYSNEHWDAWRGAEFPVLFSDEMALGAAEPINETLAEIAKADYNFGPAAKIDPLWRALFDETNAAYEKLVAASDARSLASQIRLRSPQWPLSEGANASALLSRLFAGRKAKAAASPLALLAGAIETNLGGLGLHVRAKWHGAHFCEIVASTSTKMIAKPGDPGASGVALLLAEKYDPPTLIFEEINSLAPGLGSAMVEAVTSALEAEPGVLRRLRVDDSSPLGRDGRSFWERAAARHTRFDWEITHGEADAPARLRDGYAEQRSAPADE